MYHEVRQKRIIQKPIGNLQKSIGISILSCVGYVQLEILVYQSFIDGTTHCKLYWGVYFFVKLNTVGPFSQLLLTTATPSHSYGYVCERSHYFCFWLDRLKKMGQRHWDHPFRTFTNIAHFLNSPPSPSRQFYYSL